MEIESVEVIPMRGESIWEDVPNNFDVSCMTTSYDEWLDNMKILDDNHQSDSPFRMITFEDECLEFAKSHKAYMIAPVGIFGKTVYQSRTIKVPTLNGFVVDGPLYAVIKRQDKDEKTYYQVRYGVAFP